MALMVAISMVAISYVVRTEVLDEDSASGDSAGHPSRLLCDPALADVCQVAADETGMDVVVEPFAVSVERLGSAVDPPPPDVWLTTAAGPAIVDDERGRNGLSPLVGDVAPVGHARLGVVAWTERAARLAPCSGGSVGWGCVADAAGRPWTEVGGDETWGLVKPRHLSPDETAIGLATLGQLASQLLGRSDFSAADLDDPAFAPAFRQVERSMPAFGDTTSDVVDTLAVRGPASLDVAGLPEPAAERAVRLVGSRFGGLTATYAAGGMEARVQVVAAPLSPGAGVPGGTLEQLAAALADAGWETGDVVDEGLPAPGVLEALRRRWQEVTR